MCQVENNLKVNLPVGKLLRKEHLNHICFKHTSFYLNLADITGRSNHRNCLQYFGIKSINLNVCLIYCLGYLLRVFLCNDEF